MRHLRLALGLICITAGAAVAVPAGWAAWPLVVLAFAAFLAGELIERWRHE